MVVSTTEHTHAFATLPALQLGKHVYCEKPLTHDVWEAASFARPPRRPRSRPRWGPRSMPAENYRRVVELIQANAIGPVTEAHVWVRPRLGLAIEGGRGEKPRHCLGPRAAARIHRPSRRDSTGTSGSAPRPHVLINDVYFPGPKWYRWWDFGNGTMSDLGSHWIDLPFWA